jgi:outer membrane lipoprotein-sorting protein
MSFGHNLDLRIILTVFLLLMVLVSQTVASQDLSAAETAAGREDDELLGRIWDGVQQAQDRYAVGCGNLTEIRNSELLEQPLILRGKFCAAGATKFNLQYSEPHPIKLTFNEDYLNVSTGSDITVTEVFQIGRHVRRTQDYFSGEDSIHNIKKSFVVLVQESSEHYELKLVPKNGRFEKRVNYIVVKLDKERHLLHSLEVDGKSGVNSVFQIEITELNPELSEDTFLVYEPR